LKHKKAKTGKFFLPFGGPVFSVIESQPGLMNTPQGSGGMYSKDPGCAFVETT
jgi:hypothetical protein